MVSFLLSRLALSGFFLVIFPDNDQRCLYVISSGQNHLYRITIDADNNPATNPTATDVLACPLPDPGPDQTATLIIQAIPNQIGTLRNQATLDGQTATTTTVVSCPTGVCPP